MKIDILCTDGSPIGVTLKSLWGEDKRIGVGGSEYALLTMCEAWSMNKRYSVRLYNDPYERVDCSFQQLPTAAFNPKEDRDVLIIFRSPNPRAIGAKGKKVWWSCDQYTIGNFKAFAPMVDKIVCISEFHRRYFEKRYGINNSIVIDLPIRIQDYKNLQSEKIPYSIIFTSVPDRGLDNLWRIWPQIVEIFPDASLRITSDYRLWGYSANNERHRIRWIIREDVKFLGAVKRKQLLQEIAKSEIFLYPCSYDELFCIACAEAEALGAYPITSSKGALETTNLGTILPVDVDNPSNDKEFVEAVSRFFSDREMLLEEANRVSEQARERFGISRILDEWENLIFRS